MREHRKGKNGPRWEGGEIKRICQICKKEFFVKPCYLKKSLEYGKTCSNKCKGIAKKGNKNPKWAQIEKRCLTCGKKIWVAPHKIKRGHGKFCSKSYFGTYNVKHMKYKNTSIELKVEEILKKLGIQYESQKVIPEGRTIADFYIPEQRVVIYADGIYWHSSLKTQQRDATQDLLLGLNGYKVLRLPETEINNSKRSCLRRIKNIARIES